MSIFGGGSTSPATSPRRRTLFSSASFSSYSPSTTTTRDSSLPPTPIEPLPRDSTSSRPADIVINRLHEVKRITKSLASYFEGLASAHSSHSASLLKLSGPNVITTPLHESSLFIPVPPVIKASSAASTNGTIGTAGGGELGWGELLNQIKDNNKSVAEEHLALSTKVTKDVVVPLKKLRVDIKAHISVMEKEVTKLSNEVLKERESSVLSLSHLARTLHPPPLPAGLVPPPPSTGDDPFLHNYTAETQLKIQLSRENELLALVLGWQDKSEKLEREVWTKVGECWAVWEATNSNLLLGNQQRSVLLAAAVDSVAPDAEWNFFAKLNHLVPSNTLPQPLDELEKLHPHLTDPQLEPVKVGILDRQKRFVKTWKTAYFVLTPAGNLHEYSTSASALNKPFVSIHLPLCTLGPMPTPEPSTKGRQLEAMFTIESPDSRNVFRAKSWEELSGWWEAFEKFAKTVSSPLATPTNVDESHGDIGAALGAGEGVAAREEEELADATTPPATSSTPPPLPPRNAPRPTPTPITTDDDHSEIGDLGSPPATPAREGSAPPLAISSPPAPIHPEVPTASSSSSILVETPDSPSFTPRVISVPSSPAPDARGDGDVEPETLSEEQHQS